MTDIHIDGVPDDLYEHFKHLAQKHHRTLSAETIALIKNAVTKDEQLEQLEQRRTALARIAERRRHLPPTPSETLDSLTMLREDRAR